MFVCEYRFEGLDLLFVGGGVRIWEEEEEGFGSVPLSILDREKLEGVDVLFRG